MSGTLPPADELMQQHLDAVNAQAISLQPGVMTPYVPPTPSPQTELPTADDLMAQHLASKAQQQTFATTPQATALSYLQPPTVHPDAVQFLKDTAVGRIMSAIGHGIEEPWTASKLGLSDQSRESLARAGIFNDWSKGQRSILKAFNEGVIAPLAAGVDAAIRAGQSAIGGVEAGVAQGAKEVGAPLLGRDVAGMIEAGTSNPASLGFSMVPMNEAGAVREMARPSPINIPMARDLGVVGEPEGVYEGTAPRQGSASDVGMPETPEAHIAVEPPKEEATQEAPTSEVSGESEEVTGSAEEPTPQTEAAQADVPPPDVHVLARQIDPVTFNEFDALAQHRADLQTRIGAAVDSLRQQVEAQAPHADEIADLEARLQDTTPRLAKKYQARLEAIRPEYDAFMGDEFTMAALTRDTPDISDLRQQLLETDFRMRDLAPQVTAAYRQASDQMPAPEPVAGEAAQMPEEAPSEAPAPAVEGALPETTTAPQATPETTASPEVSPEAAARAVPEAGPEVAPVNIAQDVQQKLVAAGRPEDEAQAAAAVTEALWRIRAARFGGAKGTAEQMYAREAPTIRGPRQASRVREMAQGGRELKQVSRDKRLGQTYWQLARGKIRLMDDGRSVITLMREANASTFLHETGHDWLERLMQDGSDPDAPADLRADAATVRKYLGLGDDEAIPTRAHEKFARSFERYFMEGRAPSQALSAVFARFKDWLTAIYETVARLRAPISPDIRDVFDRLLATPEERAAIVLERPEETPEFEPSLPKARPTRLFRGAPKEPTRLVSFLRKLGGVRDEGGDIRAALGRSRALPGLINNATGLSLDDAARRAKEMGYFPEAGDELPTINDLRDAIAEDMRGNARYSEYDVEAVRGYQEARAHNAEIERLAAQHAIDPRGMTREEFAAALSERVSLEKQAEEQQSLGDAREAHFSDARSDALDWAHDHDETTSPDALYGLEGPRTEAELETDFRQANSAGRVGQGEATGEQSAAAGPHPGAGEEGTAHGGRATADARSDHAHAGTTAKGVARRGAIPDAQEPFGEVRSGLIDAAGNIRLDNINSTEDVNQVLRDIAADNEDLWGARRGVVTDDEIQQFADSLGVRAADVNIERLRMMSVEDDFPLAARILASRELLVQSAKVVHAAMAGTDEMAYAEARTRHLRIQETVSGITAEWGRAGRAFRRLADEAAEAQELSAFLEQNLGKTLFQLKNEMKKGATLSDPAKIAKFIVDSEKPSFSDMLLEYWINSLISGPITHKVILVGQTALAVWRATAETATAAAIGSVREAFGDTGPRVYWGEVPAQIGALVRGQRNAVQVAWKAIKSGATKPLPGEEGFEAQGSLMAFQPQPVEQFPGTVGEVVRLPSRAIAGMHSYTRAMGYAQAIADLAYRQAANEKLIGAAFEARVADLMQNPPAAMMAAAREEATASALMGRGGEFTERLSALVNSSVAGVPVKFVMPFVRIVSNVNRQALLERSVLGLLDSGIRDNLMGRNGAVARDTQIARVVGGTAVMGAIGSLVLTRELTGAGPSDPKERDVWRATGRMPYSVRIGDNWYSYGRLGVLGKIMSVAADISERWTDPANETATQALASVLTGTVKSMLDDSFMRGPADLIQAVEDPVRYGPSYVRDFLTGFVPFSVGMSQVAREADPYLRQARTLVDSLQERVPGLSEDLTPAIGIWGQPIRQPEYAGAMELVFGASNPAAHDPVSNALLKLGWFPAMPRRQIRGVNLAPQQYAYYAQTSGRLMHMMMQEAIGQFGFSLLARGEQTKFLQDIVSKAREEGQTATLMRYPAILQEATNNKLTILRTGRNPQ